MQSAIRRHRFRCDHLGFVMNFDSQMENRSLRTTNLWRKPHRSLGEYEKADLKEFFKCKAYGGWPACDEGNGKEMIRVGAIKSLSVHFHTSNIEPERRYYVDMSQIRLNHYMMRTKQDAIESASKWHKLPSRLGQIALHQWFRLIYDD